MLDIFYQIFNMTISTLTTEQQMEAITILKSYIDDLNNHDWTYVFSDDHQAYMVGSKTHSRLLETAKSIDPTFEIWNTIAPEGFKDGKNV